MESKVRKLYITQRFTLGVKGLISFAFKGIRISRILYLRNRCCNYCIFEFISRQRKFSQLDQNAAKPLCIRRYTTQHSHEASRARDSRRNFLWNVSINLLAFYHQRRSLIGYATHYPFRVSINLLVFYHQRRSLIGYATHYLFCDSE